jgi:hypothetical protein
MDRKKKSLTDEELKEWLYFTTNAYHNLAYLTNRIDELWEVLHLLGDDPKVKHLENALFFAYQVMHSDTEFRERAGRRAHKSIVTLRQARGSS